MADLFYGSSFDYIVIGIQNGDEYTLSMYKIAGGQPSGKPVHTVTGTGILKKVCYACPLQDYASPNYYAFTKYAELYGMGPDFPYWWDNGFIPDTVPDWQSGMSVRRIKRLNLQ